MFVFFFKQKTAYEVRISDWSSDVCSSDLLATRGREHVALHRRRIERAEIAFEHQGIGTAVGLVEGGRQRLHGFRQQMHGAEQVVRHRADRDLDRKSVV